MANDFDPTVADRPRLGRVIACGNQKGGVGKTTTTVHLAAALAEMGQRVLVWDLDSNAGATKSLGIPDIFQGSCSVLVGENKPEDVILSRHPEEAPELPVNVDLLPASRDLEEIDTKLRQQKKHKFMDMSQ